MRNAFWSWIGGIVLVFPAAAQIGGSGGGSSGFGGGSSGFGGGSSGFGGGSSGFGGGSSGFGGGSNGAGGNSNSNSFGASSGTTSPFTTQSSFTQSTSSALGPATAMSSALGPMNQSSSALGGAGANGIAGRSGLAGLSGAAGGLGGNRGGFGGNNMFGGNSNSNQNRNPQKIGVQRFVRAVIQADAGTIVAGPPPTAVANPQATVASIALALPTISGVSYTMAADGTATLVGSVGTDRERRLAAGLLELEPGIRHVDNQLTVTAAPAAR